MSTGASMASYPTLPYSPHKALRIVVTGAGGFIAGALAKRLHDQVNDPGVPRHTVVCADWRRADYRKVRQDGRHRGDGGGGGVWSGRAAGGAQGAGRPGRTSAACDAGGRNARPTRAGGRWPLPLLASSPPGRWHALREPGLWLVRQRWELAYP